MRVLITGLTGFVGSHLAEYVLSKNAEVYGSIRWRSRTENIEHLRDHVTLIDCDLKDLSSVNALVQKSMPDLIFHLASQSYVVTSWHSPNETMKNNISCQLNLLEAVRASGLDPLIQVAGSSEEYGFASVEETPVAETELLRPLSPYAVSKVAQDLLGYQYFKSYGLKVVRTRAFNHTGPRRGEVFVESNFAKQIAEIEAGIKKPVVSVGNLEAKRDFSDVRDIVKGYWLALEKGIPGEVYNLATGKMWAIRKLLDYLLSMSSTEIQVRQDPSRLRPSDIPHLCGDSTLFRKVTGWEPRIPFEETLKDLLNYWRANVLRPAWDDAQKLEQSIIAP